MSPSAPLGLIFLRTVFQIKSFLWAELSCSAFLWAASPLGKISKPLFWVLRGAVTSDLSVLLTAVPCEWAGMMEGRSQYSAYHSCGISGGMEPSISQPQSPECSYVSLELERIWNAGSLPFRWDMKTPVWELREVGAPSSWSHYVQSGISVKPRWPGVGVGDWVAREGRGPGSVLADFLE